MALNTAFYVLALSSFTASFLYISQHPLPITQGYGGHYQYLTIWGLTISTVSCSLGFLEDLSLASASLITLHTSISLLAGGLETLIAVSYWSVLWYDQSLIRTPDPAGRPIAKKILDLSLHLTTFIFMMADIVLTQPTKSRLAPAFVLTMSYVFILSYGLWLERCRSRNGYFPYPVMEKMNGSQRIIGFLLLGTVVGIVGCALNQSGSN